MKAYERLYIVCSVCRLKASMLFLFSLTKIYTPNIPHMYTTYISFIYNDILLYLCVYCIYIENKKKRAN